MVTTTTQNQIESVWYENTTVKKLIQTVHATVPVYEAVLGAFNADITVDLTFDHVKQG
jgi:hypothetical protein